jgi:hypothetical protein
MPKTNPTTEAQQEYLFTDLRHIECGDLQWLGREDGQVVPIYPEGAARPLRAGPGRLAHGIRLVAQKPRVEPLPPGAKAPGRGLSYEGGGYRSWGLRTRYPAADRAKGCYSQVSPEEAAIVCSESTDGYEWREKHASNIEVIGYGHDGFTVFQDPVAPAAERYKAVFMANPPPEQEAELWRKYQRVNPRYRDRRFGPRSSGPGFYLSCLYGAVSPDGLDWQLIREPLFIHKSDTDTNVFYDPVLERYVMFTRLYWENRRLVGRAEAEDFRHWSHVEPLIWPDLDPPYSQDIYTNGYTTYPGLPDYHLMFPMVYQRWNQTSDIFLYSSIDTLRWDRVPGGPIIARGAIGGNDIQYLGGVTKLVPLGAEKVALWFGGNIFPHKYPRWAEVSAGGRGALAWWPKGRLCAVQADEEGEFWTPSIQPAGRALRLNARTDLAGEVRVEICGAAGRSLAECSPVIGDGLALPVHWQGQTDSGAPAGQAVSLHFHLRSAKLFGFAWE